MELPTPESIKYRREEVVDITQSELAESAGVSQPLIARVEGGDVDPRLSTLRRIMTALEQAERGLLRAEDIMHKDVVSVSPDQTVHKARVLMSEENYSQVPVVSNDGTPEGWISTSDIVQHPENNVRDLPVDDVMDENLVKVEPDALLDEIESYLDHNHAVLVVDQGETIGIITEADVARQIS